MQGTHDSTCTSPALLSAQHHWKDSSIPDESVAADLNYLTAGSSVRSPCMPWPCTENHHPNWGGLAGCAGSTVPALQCKSTLSHQGCSSTHPPHGCHGHWQLNFKQSRNDGWQQVRPETGRKFIHGAKTALWHGREEGHPAGHRQKAVKGPSSAGSPRKVQVLMSLLAVPLTSLTIHTFSFHF